MFELPKISCFMIINESSHASKSLDCYEQQTYPNKEMVIVSQGKANISQPVDRKDIILIEAPQRLHLGSLKNLAIELTTGDYICCWSDSDLCHKDRLKTQYRSIKSNASAIASAYTEYLHLVETCAYWVDQDSRDYDSFSKFKKYLDDTLMFEKKCFYDELNALYSETQEGFSALEKIFWQGKIVPVKSGDQYLRLGSVEIRYKDGYAERCYQKDFLLSKKHQIESLLQLTGEKEIKMIHDSNPVFTFQQ